MRSHSTVYHTTATCSSLYQHLSDLLVCPDTQSADCQISRFHLVYHHWFSKICLRIG